MGREKVTFVAQREFYRTLLAKALLLDSLNILYSYGFLNITEHTRIYPWLFVHIVSFVHICEILMVNT
jgi:hypothetical protein